MLLPHITGAAATLCTKPAFLSSEQARFGVDGDHAMASRQPLVAAGAAIATRFAYAGRPALEAVTVTPQTTVQLLGPEEDNAGSAPAGADGEQGVGSGPTLPAAAGPDGAAARAAAAAAAAADLVGGAGMARMSCLTNESCPAAIYSVT